MVICCHLIRRLLIETGLPDNRIPEYKEDRYVIHMLDQLLIFPIFREPHTRSLDPDYSFVNTKVQGEADATEQKPEREKHR